MESFYWYDLETFGKNPQTTRIAQFAGIRTDHNFNIIDTPLVEYCQPAIDFLAEPEACLITGITPQYALAHGLPECELIKRVHTAFIQPGTCVLGYNNIRFDDEFIRYSLYRNFFDPYAREWQNGNSRWDILDIVRLTRALRPEGINWPTLEDGTPSNKLEHLTTANQIQHQQAHDALNDVRATIAIAKLIKQKQPRLWSFCFNQRSKHLLAQKLNIQAKTPMLHVSGMYGNLRHNMAMVVPIAQHPHNKNGIIVYDLADDPTPLITLDAERISELIFTPQDELNDTEKRIGLKTIHLNKCPVVVPLNTLDRKRARELGVDIDAQLKHLDKIKRSPCQASKIQQSFSSHQFEPIQDPDQALYSGGFSCDEDKALMQQIHHCTAEQLAHIDLPFRDQRFTELLFRYRARNYPQTLSSDEQQRWHTLCRKHIEDGADNYLSFAEFKEQLTQLSEQYPEDPDKQKLLKDLKDDAESNYRRILQEPVR